MYLAGATNAFVTAMGAGFQTRAAGFAGTTRSFLCTWTQSNLDANRLIGAYCNWKFIAPKLRAKTIELNDALTIPEYLSRRFNDHNKLLRMIVAVILFSSLCS